MKYIALVTGMGEGCNYTIGCNRMWSILDVASEEGAINACKTIVEDNGYDRIDNITLLQIVEGVEGKDIVVPIGKWRKEQEDENERRANERELARLEERKKELENRLKK